MLSYRSRAIDVRIPVVRYKRIMKRPTVWPDACVRRVRVDANETESIIDGDTQSIYFYDDKRCINTSRWHRNAEISIRRAVACA